MRSNYIDRDSWHVLSRLLMPANALCCEVMLLHGLRVGDVLSLTPEALDNRLTVYESKTGKHKTICISDNLLARLRANSNSIWVFPSPMYPSQHRTRQAVWADIKRASKAMRIPLQVSPHSARKYYACEMYKAGKSLDYVRDALNHDSITTTLIYLLDLFSPPLGGEI